MTRVLVTGASGFVGAHLVRALRYRGDDVTCLVRESSRRSFLEPMNTAFALGDVTDRRSVQAAVRGHDLVFHVAGCVASLSPRTMFTVNARGAANVARACAEQDAPPVLVVVSSLAAAGPATAACPKRETDPAQPVSIYGRSKLHGERLVGRYARDVPTTIVRPGIVFGEYDREMYKLFRAVLQTRVHISPGWRPRRFSILHGEDLATLLLQAADRGQRLDGSAQAGCGVYFAAAEAWPTFQEIGNMIGQAVGLRRFLQLRFGPGIMWGVAYSAETLARLSRSQPLLTRDKIREATAVSWCCSIEKAERELGYAPAAPLAARFRQTAAWFREQGWL